MDQLLANVRSTMWQLSWAFFKNSRYHIASFLLYPLSCSPPFCLKYRCDIWNLSCHLKVWKWKPHLRSDRMNLKRPGDWPTSPSLIALLQFSWTREERKIKPNLILTDAITIEMITLFLEHNGTTTYILLLKIFTIGFFSILFLNLRKFPSNLLKF